jgi:hypothetical protein
MAALWAKTHIAHLVKDAAVYRLETITSIGERARINY